MFAMLKNLFAMLGNLFSAGEIESTSLNKLAIQAVMSADEALAEKAKQHKTKMAELDISQEDVDAIIKSAMRPHNIK